MKARHIKKLRKKILSYKKYEVKSKVDNVCVTIKAENVYHAVDRYLEWHMRHFKEKHQLSIQEDMYETTSYYAKICVIDEKGFKYYIN